MILVIGISRYRDASLPITMQYEMDASEKYTVHCSLCSLKFTCTGNLLVHSGEKPFQCNMCSYKWIRENCLQSHIPVHSGKKGFLCNIADHSEMAYPILKLCKCI